MKPIRNLATALVLLTLFISASSSRGNENPVTQSEKEEILSVLISDTDVRAYARIEIPAQRNVTVFDDYISLNLFGVQDLLHNGIRSEVTVDYPFSEHDTVIYEWEVMIPLGFLHDAPDNRWWDMGQWHDQPDLTLGETWADLPGRSPSVSLHLKFYDGKYYFAPRYMSVEPPVDELIEIEPGVWIKLKFKIRWSQEDDGYLKIWIDDEEIPHIHYTGPNMHNGYQHYLKVGMYRHLDIATDNTVNLRSLHIYSGNSQEDATQNHRARIR